MNAIEGGGGGAAQITAFEDTWSWDNAAQARVDGIERAVKHPAHTAVRGLRIVLGECGMLAYLSYMAERLAEIARVLKNTGSVYLHCDPTASHYLKAIMDGIFGHSCFRNEIVWHYGQRTQFLNRHFSKKHDIILFYVKSPSVLINRISEPWKKEEFLAHRHDVKYDESGNAFIWTDGGAAGVRYKRPVDEVIAKGKPIDTVWNIPILNSASRERLGYPTQKPRALLDRIVNASSNRGDIVLDPFCGCGTTVESARNLNRRFIGIDISPFAIDLVRDRRLKDRSIPVNGIPVDIESAKRLAKSKPLDFEKWAVTRLPGLAPNDKQVGDSGIDGRGRILDGGGLVLAQVKGGHFSLGGLRDFLHVIEREKASCGIFMTLDKISSGNARSAAGSAGFLEIGVNRYPKAQLWSIDEYFDDRYPSLPSMADPYTGKAVQLDLFTTGQ